MLRAQIAARQKIVHERLGIACAGLIVPIEIGDNREVMELQAWLKNEMGIHVGAIRQPTVKKAILRLIARLDIDEAVLTQVCERLTQIWVK
jgi:8-amino-7-oxononanoate synthase